MLATYIHCLLVPLWLPTSFWPSVVSVYHATYNYDVSCWLHVSYSSSATTVDYISTPVIAAFTTEELYIHTHCHVTCVTFPWEENAFCPFAIVLDHMTCFGQ